jgi:hypothetical protein
MSGIVFGQELPELFFAPITKTYFFSVIIDFRINGMKILMVIDQKAPLIA